MIGIAETFFVNAVLNGVSDGVIMTDSQGTIIHINPSALDILDIQASALVGQSILNLVDSSDDMGVYRERMEKYMNTPGLIPPGKFKEEKLYLVSKTFMTRLTSIYEGGQFSGLILIFRDNSFSIASISHELRTPLTPIKGFTDLLLMQALGEINEKQKGILTHIKNSANRLGYLIEDVLYVSSIDTGRDPLKFEMVNLGAVVQSTLQHLEERTHQQGKNLNVTFDIDPHTAEIEADHKKVTRIVTNVIENAFNYTQADGEITIKISPDPLKDRVIIAVADNGPGIPKDFHKRIWHRFARHNVTMGQNSGGINIGLGLSIAKDLVEMHEGDIWFETEEGVGSTFYIALPISQPEYRTTR